MRIARWLVLVVLAATLVTARPAASVVPPANDRPSGATLVDTLPTTITQNTAGATDDPLFFDYCGMGASVWFKVKIKTPGPVVVQTRGSSFDTVIAAYTAEGGKPTSYPFRCEDDNYRQRGALSFTTYSPSQVVFIQVGGFQGATGQLRLTVNRGGTLTGVAKDATTGAPIPGACVRFEGPTSRDYYYDHFAYTSPTGFYSLSGLPAGEYRATTEGCNNDVGIHGSAPVATVAEGRTTRSPDIRFARGFVQGRVTDEASGSALPFVCVSLMSTDGSYVTGTQTTSTGFYRLQSAPGAFKVRFEDCGGAEHAPEFFPGVSEETAATTITVAAGATRSQVNASLQRGAILMGTVTGEGTHEPIEACIEVARASDGAYVASAYTYGSSSGFYRVAGLPITDVVVHFSDCRFPHAVAPEWFRDASSRAGAEIKSLSPGTTAFASALLGRGAHVGGVVRRDSGQPAAGVCVRAEPTAHAPGDAHLDSSFGYTSSTGFYSIPGVGPGDYKLKFSDCGAGVAPEWFQDKAVRNTADVVTVGRSWPPARQVLVTANAHLARQGTMHAVVVNPDTHKTARVCLSVADPDGDFAYSDMPSITGAVGVGGLASLRYRLDAYSCGDKLSSGQSQVLTEFDAVAGKDTKLGTLTISPRDADGDGVSDKVDNCPFTPNAGQADVNHDDLGNVCDLLRPGAG